MSKCIEIKEDLSLLSDKTLIATIEQLINTAEDVAYAYEIDEEMAMRIKETLDDIDIECEIIDDEF